MKINGRERACKRVIDLEKQTKFQIKKNTFYFQIQI
jgi:hypothetical protein